MPQIIEILKSDKIRKAIRKVWDDAFGNPENRPPFTHPPFTLETADLFYCWNRSDSNNSMLWDDWDGVFGMKDVIQKHVFQYLDLPTPISLDEICSLARLHLYVPKEMFEVGYMNFVLRVVENINHNSGVPLEIHRGDLYLQNDGEILLWDKGDLRVYLSSVKLSSDTMREYEEIESPLAYASIEEHALNIRVNMIASNQMFSNTLVELSQLIKSLFITFEDMYFLKYSRGHNPPFVVSNEEGHLQPYFNQILPCLDIFYNSHSARKVKFLVERIRNAMILLVEADEAKNTAIRDALSMTAIEVLTCTKGADISKTVSENVAILLEPDLKYRKHVQKIVKRLYNFRSQVMHGEVVEGNASSNWYDIGPRSLASAVLLAALERREYVRRLGYNPETFSKFLEEVQNIQYNPRQPEGVTESPLCEYWRRSQDRAIPEDL